MNPRCWSSQLSVYCRILGALGALLAVSNRVARAQLAPNQPTGTATAAAAPGAPDQSAGAVAAGQQEEAAVQMTPFEVQAAKERGYYTQNTLAGTRLNNNIADLPASITVIDKQELQDTYSTNINDVFRYQANTEGAHSYTPFVLVRSNLTDTLAGGGSTSGNFTSGLDTGNRVRGLSAVDNEEDNFFSLYRIPFDSYNTQSVEIDRGPNSIIFGTGSPAGIFNQSRTQAILDKLSWTATLTGGSWGTFRQTADLNIPLIKGMLALYVSQMYDSEGFQQKPASDITRRQYAAFTFVPFKNHKTRITGSFEHYLNYATDPNTITPIDYVTPWLSSGQPVYNPITDMVTYQSTGRTSGPYAISSTYPNYVSNILQTMLTTSTSPYFVPSLTYESATHDVMFVAGSNLENFFKASQTSMSVSGWVPSTFTSSQALVNEERMTLTTNLPTPALNTTTALYSTWYYPTVTSKGIYDWSTINIDSMDNTRTQATTYNLKVQQELLPHLNLEVSWFRQELQQLQDAPMNQAAVSTLFVDTNQYLPDGRANPHLGQPFVDVYSSDVYSMPEINNNWRVMLEYELDAKDHVPDWLKFLGHHRFLGVFTQHDDILTSLRYRPAIDGGDANYLPTSAALNNATGYGYPLSNVAIEQWMYLGGAASAGSGFGASSPGYMNRPDYGGPTTATIETYNYSTGQWQYSTINMNSLLYPTGGLSENLQDSKTFFWQSFFWNDRIIGSLGMNDDQVKNRNTVFPATTPTAVEYTLGYPNQKIWYREGPWSYIGGNTSTMGLVLHPFKHWESIDNAASRGNLLAAVARTLSFTFNKSDNFNPPAAYYTDYFGNLLGKPAGKEKDFGAEIATPDNKFFLRATWFHTTNENQIVTQTSLGRANYIDQTELHNWATAVVEIRNGENPSDQNFGNTSVYPITATMQSQIAALTGLPYNYGGNVGENGEYVNPNSTENGIASGLEIEATYNPLPNWTMKLSWGRQTTVISGAGAQALAWVNYRMPKWVAYTASDLSTVYTKYGGTQMYLGNFWQGYGYDSNVTVGNINGWTTTQNYYNSVEASTLAVDLAQNGAAAPNQREYSWRYMTNYVIDRGPLKNISLGGALRFDGRALAGYYGNTLQLNQYGQVAAPDLNRPIYTPAKTHIDAWIAYGFKLPWTGGKVFCKIQLNVADLTSGGYLLPVSYNFDGTPAAERIILPRSFDLTTSFSF